VNESVRYERKDKKRWFLVTYAVLKVGEETFAGRVKVTTSLEEGGQFLGGDGGHEVCYDLLIWSL
jgi:hypothetical protein